MTKLLEGTEDGLVVAKRIDRFMQNRSSEFEHERLSLLEMEDLRDGIPLSQSSRAAVKEPCN